LRESIDVSRAELVRLLVGLAGGIAALWAYFSISSPWLAVPAAVVVFAVFSAIAERLYWSLATPNEQRRDLEDRVRNPD
jgi:membrane protein implicated in regulation of membrane protease activity